MKNLNSITPLYRWTVEQLLRRGESLTYLQHGATIFQILDLQTVNLTLWEEIAILHSLLTPPDLRVVSMSLDLQIAFQERLSRLTFGRFAVRSIFPVAPV